MESWLDAGQQTKNRPETAVVRPEKSEYIYARCLLACACGSLIGSGFLVLGITHECSNYTTQNSTPYDAFGRFGRKSMRRANDAVNVVAYHATNYASSNCSIHRALIRTVHGRVLTSGCEYNGYQTC